MGLIFWFMLSTNHLYAYECVGTHTLPGKSYQAEWLGKTLTTYRGACYDV